MDMVYNEQLKDYICRAEPIGWAVTDVRANDDYTMNITFINGEKRVFDASGLLKKKIYAPLCRLDFFLKAHVAGDTVVWNDDIDIAPEFLYENSVLAWDPDYTKVTAEERRRMEIAEEEFARGEYCTHDQINWD